MGEQAAAINEFRELVAIHPEHADSWFNLGFCTISATNSPMPNGGSGVPSN